MARLHFAALPTLVVLIGAASLTGQRGSQTPRSPDSTDFRERLRDQEAAMLPQAMGHNITLSPNDVPDINCSVVEWKNDPATPMLSVICPPQSTFSPLYVYLKLSWLKPEDVPLSARGIMAPAKTLTKIRTHKSTAWVWLGVREKQGAQLHNMWVAFNGLEDMALLPVRR